MRSFLAIFGTLAVMTVASADTFLVSTTDDTGPGSLREALELVANAGPVTAAETFVPAEQQADCGPQHPSMTSRP